MQFDEKPEALQLNVRNNLYNIIKKEPGLHFRELKRKSNLAIGSLQYHLDYLQKKHLINGVKDSRFVRYYSIEKVGAEHDPNLLGALRQDKPKQIVLLLLKKKFLTQASIAKQIDLGLSTTSWHLAKLMEANLLAKKKRGRKSVYFLTDIEKAKSTVLQHKDSLAENMVDNFVEIINELSI